MLRFVTVKTWFFGMINCSWGNLFQEIPRIYSSCKKYIKKNWIVEYVFNTYSMKCTKRYCIIFKVRVGYYSLQKCCHDEIKIIFRLVRWLDGTIPSHRLILYTKDAAAEHTITTFLFERFGTLYRIPLYVKILLQKC